MCEKHIRRKSEVSDARLIRVGLVGPKPRLRSVGDGQQVNNPVPPGGSEGGTPRGSSAAAVDGGAKRDSR